MVEVVALGEYGVQIPQSQVGTFVARTDTSASSDAGEGLLRSGFAVSELIAAKNNSNEAGDLCHRSGKQGLHCGKACVKG